MEKITEFALLLHPREIVTYGYHNDEWVPFDFLDIEFLTDEEIKQACIARAPIWLGANRRFMLWLPHELFKFETVLNLETLNHAALEWGVEPNQVSKFHTYSATYALTPKQHIHESLSFAYFLGLKIVALAAISHDLEKNEPLYLFPLDEDFVPMFLSDNEHDDAHDEKHPSAPSLEKAPKNTFEEDPSISEHLSENPIPQSPKSKKQTTARRYFSGLTALRPRAYHLVFVTFLLLAALIALGLRFSNGWPLSFPFHTQTDIQEPKTTDTPVQKPISTTPEPEPENSRQENNPEPEKKAQTIALNTEQTAHDLSYGFEAIVRPNDHDQVLAGIENTAKIVGADGVAPNTETQTNTLPFPPNPNLPQPNTPASEEAMLELPANIPLIDDYTQMVDEIEASAPSNLKGQATQIATIASQIPKNEVALIGIAGPETNPHALLLTERGRIYTVRVHDKINGWQVTSIGQSAVRIHNGATERVLTPATEQR